MTCCTSIETFILQHVSDASNRMKCLSCVESPHGQCNMVSITKGHADTVLYIQRGKCLATSTHLYGSIFSIMYLVKASNVNSQQSSAICNVIRRHFKAAQRRGKDLPYIN